MLNKYTTNFLSISLLKQLVEDEQGAKNNYSNKCFTNLIKQIIL